ncbi:MAG: DNA (cytosine-5-)-methyltransferase [Firmicutes bacterium HGW-Firmicutes-4]|jgi:DNA (cytosine-5)-methyltransferase 1|nr:MAG: DNA (cytosine-5-)-methyltransferase [Firmicutes bacterium HGW-Firmicutes-4]
MSALQKNDSSVISLFSGGMGLDIGLMQAGLNIQIGQDIDKACVSTMRLNGHSVIDGDIRKISAGEVLKLSGLAREEPFLICGGPPCQPFSTAGKRLGINDPRGSLFMDYIRMIDAIRPRFFIMENVKGLISSSINHVPLSERNKENKDPLSQRGSVFKIVLDEFEKLGYTTIYGVLDAVNYGVPQFRERLIIIGSRDHENIFLPMPSHFQLHQKKDYLWHTLRDAIFDLEDNPGECASFSKDRLDFLKMVPEGGNWKDLPPDLIKEAMGGAYLSGGGKVGFYRRLSYDQPSPTLVTTPVQKASMLCHPTKDRPLSVTEYARIQQFPDDWVFAGTTTAKYCQIGNAVPIGLSHALGQMLVAVANNSAIIKSKRTRGTDIHLKIQNAMSKQENAINGY